MKIKETLDIENTEFNEEFIDAYLRAEADSLTKRVVEEFLSKGGGKNVLFSGLTNDIFSLTYHEHELSQKIKQLKYNQKEYKTNANDATISSLYLDQQIHHVANNLNSAIFTKRMINFLSNKVQFKISREIGLWEKLRAMFR